MQEPVEVVVSEVVPLDDMSTGIVAASSNGDSLATGATDDTVMTGTRILDEAPLIVDTGWLGSCILNKLCTIVLRVVFNLNGLPTVLGDDLVVSIRDM